MNNFIEILNKGQQLFLKNSPSILTAMGVSGTVTTAYLSAKASWEASKLIEYEVVNSQWPMSNRQKIELVWDLYIPPVVSGAVTIACIIGANHVSSKRITAAVSLLTFSEKALEEYREKVVETYGIKKEQAVRDSISQDKVNANPPGTVIIGSGDVLCLELYTGRYFMSSMEMLRKATNDINAQLLRNMYVPMDEFYYLIGLDFNTESGKIGWNSDKLLELEFSHSLTSDGKPCLTFEYNYIKPI